MKKLLLLTAVLAGLFLAAAPASAGDNTNPSTITIFSTTATIAASGTAVIPASGSNSCVIDAAKQNNVALQMTYALTGTGVTSLSAVLFRSVDGTTYETVPSGTLAVTASGTSTVSGILNIQTLGVRYLKIGSITNGNSGTSAVTGLTIKAGFKPAIE